PHGPAPDKRGQRLSTAGMSSKRSGPPRGDVSGSADKRNDPLSSADGGSPKSGREDFNLRPPEPHSRGQAAKPWQISPYEITISQESHGFNGFAKGLLRSTRVVGSPSCRRSRSSTTCPTRPGLLLSQLGVDGPHQRLLAL